MTHYMRSISRQSGFMALNTNISGWIPYAGTLPYGSTNGNGGDLDG